MFLTNSTEVEVDIAVDEKRGLISPDTSNDEAWAGKCLPRRYDEECGHRCVTVERSEYYPGFTPNLYIVLAGLVEREDIPERLAETQAFAPKAYVKPTILYMGCRH